MTLAVQMAVPGRNPCHIPWSSPHPCFAIPKLSLPVRHIPASPLARCDQIRLAVPTGRSDHRPWWKLPVPVAAHSIEYPCATHTGWPTTSAEHLRRAVLLLDEEGAPGSTDARAPRPHHSVPMVSFVSLAFFSVSFSFHCITRF